MTRLPLKFNAITIKTSLSFSRSSLWDKAREIGAIAVDAQRIAGRNSRSIGFLARVGTVEMQCRRRMGSCTMAKGQICVIPIRRDIPLSSGGDSVADFAFTLWLSAAFRGGSPEEAFSTALRMVKRETALFLVPPRKQALYPIVALKSRLAGWSK